MHFSALLTKWLANVGCDGNPSFCCFSLRFPLRRLKNEQKQQQQQNIKNTRTNNCYSRYARNWLSSCKSFDGDAVFFFGIFKITTSHECLEHSAHTTSPIFLFTSKIDAKEAGEHQPSQPSSIKRVPNNSNNCQRMQDARAMESGKQ